MGRKPNHTDWVFVRQALCKELNRSSGKLSSKIADVDVAMRNLHSFRSKIVSGYFVLFDIGTPWYSDKPLLSELLIVRVQPGGSLKDVARYLQREAKKLGVVAVAIGTAFARSDRALARIWTSLGWKQEGITLAKEL